MKRNKLFIVILSFFLILTSCQGVKQGLTGSKKNNKDEFLVEKKNPLAMPPDFDKLPTPGNQEVSPETFSDNSEVKELLNIEDFKEGSEETKDDGPADIESSILKKIQ